jgi:ComEC/Rec2-related protein
MHITRLIPSPLFFPLAGFVTGLCAQAHLQLVWPTWSQPVMLCMFGASYLAHSAYHTRTTTLLVTTLSLLTASCSLHHQQNNWTAQHTLLAQKTFDCIGTITDCNAWDVRQATTVYTITTTSAYQHTDTHQLCQLPLSRSARLLVYVDHPTNLAVGDTVHFKKLRCSALPPAHLVPKPTYTCYLQKEGITAPVFVKEHSAYSLLARPNTSLRRWCWQQRERFYASLQQSFGPKTWSYVGLIFFGNKQQHYTQWLRKYFNYWGVSHVLARSGLHVVLFIMFLNYLLQFLPLHLFIKKTFLVAVCLMYDFLSWSSIPFVRAYYSYVLMQGGQLAGRQTHYLHILFFIALCVLLCSPLQLFFLDFQLTFVLTFALIMLSQFQRLAQKHSSSATH